MQRTDLATMGICGDSAEEAKQRVGYNLNNRKCTDVLFLLLFCGFWIGMFVVAGLAFKEGEPARLLRPVDYQGFLCGDDFGGRDLRSKPRIFFPLADANGNPTNVTADMKISRNFGICVSECPLVAEYNAIADYNGSLFFSYPSRSIISRCIPFDEDKFQIRFPSGTPLNGSLFTSDTRASFASVLNAANYVRESMEEVNRNAEWILFGGAMAALIGIGVLFLLRIFGGLLVWLSILFCLVSLLTITVWCFVKAGKLDGSKLQGQGIGTDLDLESSDEGQKTMYAFGVLFLVGFFVLLLLVLFMRSRIRLANKVLGFSARAVMDMPLILFFPFLMFILLIGFFVYWIYVALYLASSGEFETPSGQYPNEVEGGWKYDDNLLRLTVYHFLGLLWTRAFFHAMSEVTVAGAIGSFYYLRETPEMPERPVIKSLYHAVRFHGGSMAFGSFIITVITVVRATFEYMASKFRQARERNEAIRMCVCCVRCCLWCFERFMEFLNDQAYVQVAVHGHSFCKGARLAFKLLLSNILRVTAMTMIGNFVIFLMKVAIAALSTLIAFGAMVRDLNVAWDEAPLFPVLLMLIIGYAIASAFTDVYSTAIDTIFQCYIEDDGRATKSLQKLMHEADEIAGEGLRMQDSAPRH